MSSTACSSHVMLHIFAVITSKARRRAVSLSSIFGVLTFAHGMFGVVTSTHGMYSYHVTLLLLQSHSPANMQIHKFLWLRPLMAISNLMIPCFMLQERLVTQTSNLHTALQTSHTRSA